MPGNPCIYYGDEVGMYGYRDPFNRKCFPWDNIDEELHSFFVELGKIKKQFSYFCNSQIKFLKVNKDLCAFERIYKNEKLTIIVNRTENTVKYNILDDNDDIELIYQNFDKKCTLKNEIPGYGIIIKK